MTYHAPIDDMLFCMGELGKLDQLAELPGWSDANLETAAAVLEECAKFSEGILAPLNQSGDRHACAWSQAGVQTLPGFRQAYEQFSAGGWQGLQHPVSVGGQDLPKTIAAACGEMFNSANMAFALCPLLTDGAIEALLTAASDDLQTTYLEKLVRGEWTGTMNLTEPHAGSDLSLVRTKAEPQADGSYKLFGTKIFITYGEHDLARNIIHLVLARVDGAPDGTKGISLFVCPKYLVGKDGEVGQRNDVQCISLEHKLGIRASPTAVLQFGDNGGAVGYLIGEENRGLEYMFTMMNAARYAVGVQGVALSQIAFQRARNYAEERVQGRVIGGSGVAGVPIAHHPDVRRMLMTMRAHTEAGRALATFAASSHDIAHRHPDPAQRTYHQRLYEFLVPLVKGYITETTVDVTSMGIQVHGGMGFIEETGAAQYLRDSRILPIYEGTTAIQANDLIARKTVRDGGEIARSIAKQIANTEQELAEATHNLAKESMLLHLSAARKAFEEIIDFVLDNTKIHPKKVYAGSFYYLMLAGNLVSGWQMARSMLCAQKQLEQHQGNAEFLKHKIATAHFYADHILSRAPSLAEIIKSGSGSTLALAEGT